MTNVSPPTSPPPINLSYVSAPAGPDDTVVPAEGGVWLGLPPATILSLCLSVVACGLGWFFFLIASLMIVGGGDTGMRSSPVWKFFIVVTICTFALVVRGSWVIGRDLIGRFGGQPYRRWMFLTAGRLLAYPTKSADCIGGVSAVEVIQHGRRADFSPRWAIRVVGERRGRPVRRVFLSGQPEAAVRRAADDLIAALGLGLVSAAVAALRPAASNASHE